MNEYLTLQIKNGALGLVDERSGLSIPKIMDISIYQDASESHAKIARVNVDLLVKIENYEKNEDLPF